MPRRKCNFIRNIPILTEGPTLWINFLFLGINPIRIRYLIKPVKRRTFSANRYKGIINAKTPRMDNLEQKQHKNGFTQQNQNVLPTRRSFFQVNALSQMLTRLANGTSRITRYHQIKKTNFGNGYWYRHKSFICFGFNVKWKPRKWNS